MSVSLKSKTWKVYKKEYVNYDLVDKALGFTLCQIHCELFSQSALAVAPAKAMGKILTSMKWLIMLSSNYQPVGSSQTEATDDSQVHIQCLMSDTCSPEHANTIAAGNLIIYNLKDAEETPNFDLISQHFS